MGRGPSSQPPGMLTSASPVRARMAPRKITEERISRISPSGMSDRVRGGGIHRHRAPLPLHPAAQMAQDGDGGVHIAEAGAIMYHAHPGVQQSGTQNGQYAVFGPVDPKGPFQAPAARIS